MTNGVVFYIFGSTLVVWIIGSIFTLRWDNNNETDCFTMGVDKLSYCCSKQEVIENIHEIHEVSTKEVETKRKNMIKKFFMTKSGFLLDIIRITITMTLLTINIII